MTLATIGVRVASWTTNWSRHHQPEAHLLRSSSMQTAACWVVSNLTVRSGRTRRWLSWKTRGSSLRPTRRTRCSLSQFMNQAVRWASTPTLTMLDLGMHMISQKMALILSLTRQSLTQTSKGLKLKLFPTEPTAMGSEFRTATLCSVTTEKECKVSESQEVM